MEPLSCGTLFCEFISEIDFHGLTLCYSVNGRNIGTFEGNFSKYSYHKAFCLFTRHFYCLTHVYLWKTEYLWIFFYSVSKINHTSFISGWKDWAKVWSSAYVVFRMPVCWFLMIVIISNYIKINVIKFYHSRSVRWRFGMFRRCVGFRDDVREKFNVTLTDGSAVASSWIYLEVQHTCTYTLWAVKFGEIWKLEKWQKKTTQKLSK